MQLAFSEDQTLLVDSFRRFFEAESSMPRVREAEANGGHDPALWTSMADLGLFAMRSPGADGFALFDTALAVGEAGRQLAAGPIVEALLAHRLAAQLAPDDPLGAQIASGEMVATIALSEAADGAAQLVPGAAVAQAVVFLAGDEVRVARRAPEPSPKNHAGQPLAEIVLIGEGSSQSVVLARGEAARAAYLAALEEWRLLTASALVNIGRRGLELAADYVKEREQFGRPVGVLPGGLAPAGRPAGRHRGRAAADLVGAAQDRRRRAGRLGLRADGLVVLSLRQRGRRCSGRCTASAAMG